MTPKPTEHRPPSLSSLPVEPTRAAVLHSLLLCNTVSDELAEDVKHLVEFIGRAYETDMTGLSEAIIDDIAKFGTYQDAIAYSNGIDFDFEPDERSLIDQLFVNAINEMHKTHEVLGPAFHSEWYDYNTRDVYNPAIRRAQFAMTAVTGLPLLERAYGLCAAIGIGGPVDLEEAKNRFRHCIFWGDGFSLRFLRLLAKEQGNKEELAYYDDLLALWRYLNLGLTIVPETEEGRNKKAKEDFALISSIIQDVVIPGPLVAIDFAFLRVIDNPNVPYGDKLGYVTRYQERDWATADESRINPNVGFGISNKKGGKR